MVLEKLINFHRQSKEIIKINKKKLGKPIILCKKILNKFESKEKIFERVPVKRHSSYEDKISNDTSAQKIDPKLYVTQRNYNSSALKANKKNSKNEKYNKNEYSIINANNEFIVVRGKSNSSVQDYIKRSNSGAGCKRHLQPRQNPLIGSSPRQTYNIHLTPSDKKKKYIKENSYGKRFGAREF